MRRYTDATPTIAPLAISPDARSPCPFCGAPAGLRHAAQVQPEVDWMLTILSVEQK